MSTEKEVLAKLRDAIVNLDIDGVKKAAEEALAAGIPAYKAVVDGMAKGMEVVGQKYEDGEYFLAELIMAGETMKEGMTVLEPHLKAGDIKTAGKVVMGTVRGDLHDIGKNVVATLLKAANFEVIDLGVDISAEQFIETVKKENPDILAMSALLTTTMIEMENVMKALEKEGLRDKVKVIIGGAPITPEYAKKIGADAAARDAVEGIRICTEWTKDK
ncbi:cobalamin-binding protein [Candidatus Bathyarchaeota archaeon]|nr:MAG: cobalamin-binding protein [Candidatus Bathyarchaeota archaeon]